MYRFIVNFLAFGRWRVGLGVILLLAAGILEGIGILLLVPILQLLEQEQQVGASSRVAEFMAQFFAMLGLPLTLPVILGVFLALVVGRAAFTRWRELVLSELRLGFVDHLRIRLHAAVTGAHWQFLVSQRGSDIGHALTSDINRVGDGAYFLLELVVAGLLASVQVLIAFGLSPAVTLLALGTGAILLWVLKPLNQRAEDLGWKLTDAEQRVYGDLNELLIGLKLTKSHVAEARHQRIFEQRLTTLRRQVIEFTRNNVRARFIYQLGGALALSGLLYFAMSVAKLPLAELLVLIFVFARLLPVLSRLQQNYQYFRHALPAFTKAMELRAQCEAAAEPMVPLTSTALALKYDLALHSVDFHYEKATARPALKAINLVVPAHKTTALVGPSGAGKSTLADILLGLLIPTTGMIHLDGEPLIADRMRLWRGSVAYVPQETFLFHDTVRANLLWAVPQADDDALWECLRLATAAEFIADLPMGLDTVVGDRGIRLSGGERQRLALARALLRRPWLLLLDEATSALDVEHENRIQQAIDKLHGELTIVVIAHRLSTVRHADQIVVMDGGRIVESGTWDSLRRRDSGRFNSLLQAGHYR